MNENLQKKKLMKEVGKCKNMQNAQIDKNKIKTGFFFRKKQKKLSTLKNVEISKKRSYTPSYSHYPQKNPLKIGLHSKKTRTDVL